MELKKKRINKFVTIEYNNERIIIANTKGGLDEVHLKLETLAKIKKVVDSNLKKGRKG